MPLTNALRKDLRRLGVLGAAAVASLAIASSAHAADFNLHVDIQGAGKVAEVGVPANECASPLDTPSSLVGQSCAFGKTFQNADSYAYYDAVTVAPGWKLKRWDGCDAVTGTRCEFRIPGSLSAGPMPDWGADGPRIRAEFEDVSPPETTVVAAPDRLSRVKSPVFKFGADDQGTPVSKFTCRLDFQAPEACQSPKQYFSVPNGTHKFTVAAIDPSGNADPTPAVYKWTIDTVGPRITSSYPALTNRSSDVIPLDTADAVTVRCGLDGAPDVACNSAGFPVTNLRDGDHTLAVSGWDQAGNQSRVVVKWTVDTVAPDTRIASGPRPSTADTAAAFAFDSEPGAGFECSLDGAPYGGCASPQTYRGLRAGGHALAVRATDAAGNADPTPARYAWRVIASPAPARPVVPVPPGVVVNPAVPPVSAAQPVELPRVVWRASAGRRYTRIKALRVEGLTAAAKVIVTCRGHGCKSRKRVVSSAEGAARLDLTRVVRKAKLRPGAVLTVRVHETGTRDVVARLKIRRGLAPKATLS